MLKAAAEEGYLDTEAIFVDGTHIKASANLKKQAKKAAPKEAKRYARELFEEVNKDREEHGKKPFSDDSDKKPPEEKETVVSTTDPESGRTPATCYTRPKTKEYGHPWWTYVYDEYFDDVICPEYRALHYTTTNRDGYREYKSRTYFCKNCPTRTQCTETAKCEKTVLRHVWQDFVEMAKHVRHMTVYRELYRLRKEKIERVFADAKEKHGMRYTQYRGLALVTNWVKLKFVAMNLKNWPLGNGTTAIRPQMVENGGAYPMYILDFCNFSASRSKARSGLFTRTGFFDNLKRHYRLHKPVMPFRIYL